MGTNIATFHHTLLRRYQLQAVALLAMLLFGWIPAISVHADATAVPQPEQPTLTVQDDMVILNWVYTVDPGIATYTLERSESRSRSAATVVEAPVLSATGDGNPIVAYYTMIDSTAQPGRGYAYWLTITDQIGNPMTFGPWTTGQIDDASEHQHVLFLPFVAS